MNAHNDTGGVRFSGATQITYKPVLGIASYQGTTLVVPAGCLFFKSAAVSHCGTARL